MLDLPGEPVLSVEAQRHIRADAAALLRHVWQSFPKTLTEPEEEPDER